MIGALASLFFASHSVQLQSDSVVGQLNQLIVLSPFS